MSVTFPVIVRNAITRDRCIHLSDIMCKRLENGSLDEDYFRKNAYITTNSSENDQVLLDMWPIVEKYVEKKLIPQYSLCRIWTNGQRLRPHLDSVFSEYAVTMTLSFEADYEWPIYFSDLDVDTGNLHTDKIDFVPDEQYDSTMPYNRKGAKCILSPGDMAIYIGHRQTHWRDIFEGKQLIQLSLFYIDAEGEYSYLGHETIRNKIGLPHLINKGDNNI